MKKNNVIEMPLKKSVLWRDIVLMSLYPLLSAWVVQKLGGMTTDTTLQNFIMMAANWVWYFVTWLMVTKIERRSMAPYKIKEWALLWQLLLGIGLGLLIFFITFLLPALTQGRIIMVNPYPPRSTRGLMLFTLFNQFLFVGPTEEFVYRGYLLDRCREATGSKWGAVLIMTCLFVLPHIVTSGLGVYLLSPMVLSLLTAVVRVKLKLGSIFALGVAHALANSLLTLCSIYLMMA